ncbi:uncharacterized protein LOC143629210 isoform X2 [Bidens hawaiensis]|uniref:uncharacterized protein LOC143629210 isoform X2 n=1 Tax=Bidens hawaiensis TaxID=980011 RepID=UPI004049C14B
MSHTNNNNNNIKMSDTLADLASWLPSDFLSVSDHHKPPPYDFTSSSSSESDDDDVILPGLTHHRFTRSVSLQERLTTPYPLERVFFSGSPESTLNRNPTTSFGKQANEDALNLFYPASGEVAGMKMTATVNHGGFGNRTLLGAPRPLGPHVSHNNNQNEAFIRQQLLRERVNGGRFVASRPVGFGQSAWHVQRCQQPVNEFGSKPVPGGYNSGCGRTIPVVKKGCAGTGVFLPRNYNNAPLEVKKNPACSPTNPPAKVPQYFNKAMDYNIPQPQANIHGMFSRQHQVQPLPHHHLKYEELAALIMAHRQNTLMVAQQRRNSSHDVVQPEVVLPQEWTY